MTDTERRTNAKLQRENEVLRETLLCLCESISDSICYDPTLHAKAEALHVLASGMASADN